MVSRVLGLAGGDGSEAFHSLFDVNMTGGAEAATVTFPRNLQLLRQNGRQQIAVGIDLRDTR
jgi:hypothetical protein